MQLIESIIDTQRESYDVIGSFNVLDDVELTLEITGNLAPWNNPSFELHGLKADLTKVRQITGISVVDKTKKIVKINLLNQMTTVAGTLQLQLIIKDVNRTSSTIFCVKVNKSLEIDKTTSTDSIKIYADLEELKKSLTANEAVRNENEGVRETAEELRQLAETEREEKFTQIEDHWNSIKDDEVISEIQRSRTSIFEGEKSSLDERLNTDLSEINRKFDDGQFIEYNNQNITANNSLAGYIKDMKIEGETYQNLVNNSVYGARIIQFAFTKNNINLFKSNTKYSVFINDKTGKVKKNQISNDASQHVWKPNNSEIFYTFITPDHVYRDESLYVYASESNPFVAEDETKIKVLVLEGDYTNKPIPLYFEGIKSVGEDEENKISILSRGKNLLNIKNNDILHSQYINQNGEILKSGDWTTIDKLIYVHGLKTLISNKGRGIDYGVARVACYNKNKKCIGTILPRQVITTIIDIPLGTTYIKLCGRTMGNIDDWQLEEGTTVTQYEPYKEDKKDILLPSPLRGFSDGVKDTIEFINNEWCYVQRIDKVVLNGGESISLGTDLLQTSEFTQFFIETRNKFIRASKALSNKFIYKYINEDGTEHFYLSGQRAVIILKKSHLLTPDVEGFKAWLQANPTTVYYELETPVITPIDLNPNLISWEGTTHIFSKNSISPNINCKVSTNIPALLSDLQTENKSLKNDLNENNEKIIDASLYSVENDYRLTLLELGLV